MPGYKGHLIGGALAAFVLIFVLASCYVVPVPLLFVGFGCALLGALFPDIDIKSKGQKLFFRFLFFVALIFALKAHETALAVIGVVMIIPLIVRHRGLTHQWWFVIGFPVCVALLGGWYAPTLQQPLFFNAAFFIIGALSHLMLDALS